MKFSLKKLGIALSYVVHIFTDNYLVLSQYTRLTDGPTDGQTDRQTVDSNTVRILRSRTVKVGLIALQQHSSYFVAFYHVYNIPQNSKVSRSMLLVWLLLHFIRFATEMIVECRKEADVVFILDSTSNLQYKDFQTYLLGTITEIIRHLDVDSGRTRVAAVYFANTAKVLIILSNYLAYK